MSASDRFRLPALLCSLIFLSCVLIAHPFAEMGICDDWSYIFTAHRLATSGHIVYVGWASAMLGWQLYLAAAFIKLFGFSFTVVRMSTLFVAVLTAFFLQRILARIGLSVRNSTLGTLTLVLSPLFMMLSATFMSDIHGLFAIVLCLYLCLRALQTTTGNSAAAWICLAVFANALCGTSRQIAWLGLLVMVPSTLWLLRARRRVLLAGAAATLAGALFIVAAMHWFNDQPYAIPEHLVPKSIALANLAWSMIHLALELPFLLLPLAALFLSQFRNSSRRTLLAGVALALLYVLAAWHLSRIHPNPLLEPVLLDWVNVHGIYESTYLPGQPPLFLNLGTQIALTIASVTSLFCILATTRLPILRRRRQPPPTPLNPQPASVTRSLSTLNLTILLGPFTAAYLLLLIPRASDILFDRYLLPLLVVAAIVLLRLYQNRIRPQLPIACTLLVALYAVYSVAVTHNLFSLYRARIALASELHSAGIPDTAIDAAWEQNSWVELQHAPSIVYFVGTPSHTNTATLPTTPTRIPNPCPLSDRFPHLHFRKPVAAGIKRA